MQNVTKRTFEIEECKSEAERIEIELKEAERDQITVDREKGQIAGKLEGFYAEEKILEQLKGEKSQLA
jgi:hypothetical protein